MKLLNLSIITVGFHVLLTLQPCAASMADEQEDSPPAHPIAQTSWSFCAECGTKYDRCNAGSSQRPLKPGDEEHCPKCIDFFGGLYGGDDGW